MSDAKAAGSDALYLQLSPNWLLQLPGPALDLVLQKLDVCSLISIAASCSQLYHSLPWQASLSRVQITCSQESLGSFKLLHERHGACLTNLRHCSIGAEQNSNEWRDIKRHPWAGLRDLPLPHLCELHLEGLELQLESADGFSGVLHDCTDLTSLQIEQCQVVATPAASAAIAALPKLRHLWLLDNYEGQESTGSLFGQIRLTRPLFPELQHPLQITNLSLDLDNQPVEHLTQLEQLSVLVNLEELTLHGLPDGGVPGGLPSQLVKLKSLYIQADEWCAAEHFQHLGRYTALQDFGIDFGYFRADYLAGIGQLSQLTCLALRYDDLTSSMDFSTASTSTWAQLSALQKLSLSNCAVQPEALAAFSQLRDLELDFRRPLGDTALKGVLSAMSKLAQLTKLSVSLEGVLDTAPAVSGEVFTSLTASTNLCALQLCWRSKQCLPGLELFSPFNVYPNLRTIDCLYNRAMLMDAQHIQLLCSCCPAVESLAFALCADTSPTACQPLLELTQLTALKLHGMSALAADTVAIAAQLTGLKQLSLTGLTAVKDPSLLQLTTLTALQELTLHTGLVDQDSIPHPDYCSFKSKVRVGRAPDVWSQFLRHLLQDAACRQTLLLCNLGAPLLVAVGCADT